MTFRVLALTCLTTCFLHASTTERLGWTLKKQVDTLTNTKKAPQELWHNVAQKCVTRKKELSAKALKAQEAVQVDLKYLLTLGSAGALGVIGACMTSNSQLQIAFGGCSIAASTLLIAWEASHLNMCMKWFKNQAELDVLDALEKELPRDALSSSLAEDEQD
jgi:hypothetical protein